MNRGAPSDPTREEARSLFVEDPPAKADLALVFGHHDPGVASHRASHAARLFREGFVPRLLLSGGGGTTQDELAEAHQMASVALALGVPESALLLETRSRNTFQNAAYSLEALRDAGLLGGISAVLLVSCPWHMRRVLLVTRQTFPPRVRLLCCPHAGRCTEGAWELTEDCRQAVSF